MKKWKYLSLTSLLIALAWVVRLPSPQVASAEPILQELRITDFSDGIAEDVVYLPEGISLSPTAFSGSYLSPVLTAPIPFNVLVPNWTAVTTPTADLHLLVRTGSVDGDWQPWTAVHAHADWNEPGDNIQYGEMLLVPEVDGRHSQIQFAVNFTRENTLTQPILNDIMFVLIDSTVGPTTAEMVQLQAQRDAAPPESTAESALTYPRPPVVTREIWCTSPDCDYDPNDPQIISYANATHMIVHHTVSSNTPRSDWAPVVRAIWSFHTYPASDSCTSCRGWGDIGYNYLVDQNGVIYEGHLNRDYLNEDVVGTHASGANTGSMGISLIGNFTDPEDYPTLPGIVPPQPMIDSLLNMLTWKAEQRNINVFEASATLPYLDWGLPHLSGHRDVYGATECPGDQAHRLIPGLRQTVAARLGIVDPYTYVSETNPSLFTKSAANWYEGLNECGHNGHSYYTWSTTNPSLSANWGRWTLPVPEDGRYLLQAHIPYCSTGRSETAGAIYEVTHLEGTTSVLISHQANLGLWTTIGEFDMRAGGNNSLYLDDLVTTDNDLGMWFDDVRLLKVGEIAEITANTPVSNAWLNTREITFTWTVTSGLPVLTNTLVIGTDSSLSAPLVTQSWPTSPISYTHTFTQDYDALYWQVTAEISSTVGTAVATTPSRFGIDTVPPTATINTIYHTNVGTYVLLYNGSDNSAGIAAYNLDYQKDGDLTWTPWLTGTTATSSTFIPPDANATYNFRVQAIDRAGNVETAHPNADMSTIQAIELPHAIMLPIITR